MVPKWSKKPIEKIYDMGKRRGFTHIACAIVLVFWVATKADTHSGMAGRCQIGSSPKWGKAAVSKWQVFEG